MDFITKFTGSAKALQTCKFQGECDLGKEGLSPLNDALTTTLWSPERVPTPNLS